jgi:predicted RNA-binding Zn ribbon-like protein
MTVARSPAFELVAGHTALDFVNTVDWRADSARRLDLIGDVGGLAAWARQAGLASAAEQTAVTTAARRDGREAERGLRRARHLRELLARLFLATANGGRPAARDLRRLNAFLGAALRQRRVAMRGSACVWSWAAETSGVDRLLWPIVLAAADLLTSDVRTGVRECAAHGCGWLFLDTSRSQRRRWCTMASCGNRAKARRFYERTRA